jgi:hypothetical protein
MAPILEIAYLRMNTWALPLRAAIDATPALKVVDAEWRMGLLSDLAFAISTHRSCIPDLIVDIDDNMRTLITQFDERDTEIDRICAEGLAISLHDYALLRRILSGVGSLIVESRACFEKLARFYRLFLKQYFDEAAGSDKTCYAAIAAMSDRDPEWANELGRIRHDALHDRSLWLALEVRHAPVVGHASVGGHTYEPIFLLNWRPGMFQPEDCVTMQTLREVGAGLEAAADGLQLRLVRRIEALR